jgi:serine/threonine protein kinase
MELCDMNLEAHIKQEWPITMRGKRSYFNKSVTPENRRDEIARIMKDISAGIAFIHLQGEIHRDLKPHNGMSGSSQLSDGR